MSREQLDGKVQEVTLHINRRGGRRRLIVAVVTSIPPADHTQKRGWKEISVQYVKTDRETAGREA